MTPERWQRIHAIFDEALRRAPAAREDYLEQACANDPEVRALVSELLAHDAQAAQTNFLPTPNHPLLAFERPLSAPALDRQHIGRYRVERILGEGSFGRVYLARDEAIIHEHARLSGFPANKITEVRRMIDPTTATESR